MNAPMIGAYGTVGEINFICVHGTPRPPTSQFEGVEVFKFFTEKRALVRKIVLYSI